MKDRQQSINKTLQRAKRLLDQEGPITKIQIGEIIPQLISAQRQAVEGVGEVLESGNLWSGEDIGFLESGLECHLFVRGFGLLNPFAPSGEPLSS